jgi:hypothetical protein
MTYLVTLYPNDGDPGFLTPSGGLSPFKEHAARFPKPWDAENVAQAALARGFFCYAVEPVADEPAQT